MTADQPRNLVASVRQRLLNIAKRDGEAFDLVLTRYALERLLYRLGQSVSAQERIAGRRHGVPRNHQGAV
jgi:hypothetical protein